MSNCKYVKGGSKKYVLVAPFIAKTKVKPKKVVTADHIRLLPSGHLFIETFYEWDGPSGPTFDTDNFMDGSLVHDALYDLMRQRLLKPIIVYRWKADKELIRQCKKDGMFIFRRMYVWAGVRIGEILPEYSHEKKKGGL